MGSRTKAKSKRRGKRQASPTAEQIERHLEKGDYKQALKDAKVSYRQSPNEYRKLIEYAYIGRAQQLARHGNHEAGRAVAEDLLALGVSQPTVQAGLPELFVALGMLDWLSGNADVSADELAALQIQAADHAVLRPDGAPRSMPDIADGARRIRAAIEALEKGDEDGALSQLKGIARDSPFADWRFLVRGLAAYYRRDTAQMEANWQQLDADRFAARIARPLAVLAGAAPHDKSDAALQGGLTLLDRHLTSQSLQAQLGSLSGAVLDGDWDKALRTLWSLRSGMRQLDERLYARLTRWLCARLVQDGQVAELDRMTRIADPLPLDPHWNRARALVREFSDEVSAGAERPYWQKYLLDVPRVPTLSTNEREVAQGLVWRRLAQDHAEEAGALRRCRCGASHEKDIAEAVERAVHCLEECMRLAPMYAPAYESLADLYEAAEQPQQAADAYRRALDQLPYDTDALRYLTMHHFSVDEPVEAQPYARRLLRLKPLDKGVQSLVWAAHVGAARWYALRGQFEQGRAEFGAADELMPARCADYDALARKAAFEMKAGNDDAAQQLVAAACDSLEEPAPLWLLLTIEANRHELSENEVLLYEKRWTDALKRRCRGATAGAMCKLLHAHLVELTGYRCRQDQLKRCWRTSAVVRGSNGNSRISAPSASFSTNWRTLTC